VLADEASRVAALEAGEVDVALQLNPENLDQFAGSDRYTTGLTSSSWLMTLRINETKAPFDRVEVRRALNYAIDKEAITRSVLRGSVTPSAGQLAVEQFDAVDPSVTAYPYDPDRARSLLRAAGVADPLEVDIELSSGTYVAQDTIVQVIAAQLAQVGVKLNIKQAPFPTWVERTRTPGVAPLIYIGFGNYNGSTVENLTYFAKPYSQVHYDDKAFEDLVVRSKAATTEADQQALIFEAQRIFHDNAHAVFLFPQPLTYVVDKRLAWTPRGAHWLRPLDFAPKGTS
jgi:peptide/nickel transport system substrate-binding protein